MGTCISNLTVDECTELPADRFKIVLRPADSVTNNKLSVGDVVMISEADSKIVIKTTGSIVELTNSHVVLYLDRSVLRLLLSLKSFNFDIG